MIKIRASQINGCAYCIDMDTEVTRKLGESENKIYALSAWHESPLFNDEERAILELTEEMALISVNDITDETYKNLKKYFDDKTISDVPIRNLPWLIKISCIPIDGSIQNNNAIWIELCPQNKFDKKKIIKTNGINTRASKSVI